MGAVLVWVEVEWVGDWGWCGSEGWVRAFGVGVVFLVGFTRDRYLDFVFLTGFFNFTFCHIL